MGFRALILGGASSFLLAAVGSGRAAAGVYAAPEVRWSAFALRPIAGEPTPNYYGYGVSLGVGYSVAQVLGIGAFGTDVPARLKSASTLRHDATLTAYGGEVGLRLADSVALGLRGGTAAYRLLRQTRAEEIPGSWSGPTAALVVGALSRLGKQSFFQTSLEVLHTVLRNDKSPVTARRQLDAFAMGFALIFDAQSSFHPEDSILKDFVDTLSFF